jgi:hypothetical protein
MDGKARARIEPECIVGAQGIEFEEICHARTGKAGAEAAEWPPGLRGRPDYT